MTLRLHKIRTFALCLACSLLLHFLPGLLLGMFASYNFGAPVQQPPVVMVDLAEAKAVAAPRQEPEPAPEPAAEARPRAAGPAQLPATHPEPKPESKPAPEPEPQAKQEAPKAPEPPAVAQDAPPEPAADPEEEQTRIRKPRVRHAGTRVARPVPPLPALPAVSTVRQAAWPTPAPRLKGSDFLSSQQEKLSYVLTMHGVPIGSAELEAKQEKGITSIVLRVRSNAAISSFYPVDDLIETRHVDGQYIMTKIRQTEGNFQSDELITINPGKKQVDWVDFLQRRALRTAVPDDDVLDSLSGIYYLRNRQLEVGRTEYLHIYDSEVYAEVPVEILRKEEIRLANFNKVATLVVKPLQKTAGIFRRTGDLLIWMTDDARKVPVKMETTIALGKVTAELISAESQSHQEKQAPSLSSSLPVPQQAR
ncbi:hypothetical protein GMST_18760 [Geomonas silvestris]|uniref:DUF3108 domain-containing protein n=1 Tax=Geomonas silvestris TaxID=2740184 RepID=A0A6V8MHS1_9BACT|nr:DUF3108 domain-containing protein [Geomonas silvestris]GFO59551.1 hypothetical protein GMST_18760 [Geomonas silvestris]